MKSTNAVALILLTATILSIGCRQSLETAVSQKPVIASLHPSGIASSNRVSQQVNSTSEETNPFELMASEFFGELKLGLTAAQVVEILGSPETKGETMLWEADGLYHQDWYYPQQGITLYMASETPGERQTVFAIMLTSPSTLKTQRGIGIGDSYTEVMQAYKDEEDPEMSIPDESFIAGSIYGGLIFSFEDGIVKQIFLGSAAE